jgi:hypothetical protein
MDVPTLGLFGPSSDVHYAPLGPRTDFVRGSEFYGLDKTTDPYALMLTIDVDSVVKAALKLMKNA